MTARSEVLRLLDIPDALLRPSEVATLFGVDPKTVNRWSRSGRLPALRTAGGHRRYRAADVRALAASARASEAVVDLLVGNRGCNGCGCRGRLDPEAVAS